ncbi:hypothetical protein IW261DRAFT_1510630 [Armillaria novae-zelandiae]|uniref:DUF6534 domain-containing protein n=1 Tax=Armillaria novae-zelandiae TaxID=153914 RepID=A0AA39NU80_9AGAR|nr:hypothetical protein IW261DRAFT_1510630 [Armillaria novae-zelandiae]
MLSQALPSISDTLGAFYIGATIAAVLYGVTVLQIFIYYRRYTSDWWVYRYSVGILWALDSAHVALSVYTVYFFLIYFFGDLNGALQYHSWSQKLYSFLNDLLIVYIQGLYALRLWQLGRNFHQTLVCFILFTVMASFGTGIYVAYDTYTTPNFVSASSIKTSVPVFFSTTAAADLIIAIPMFYYLRKSRAVIHVPSTANVLLRLMRLVLMSGLATSVCSLLCVIFYFMWPKSLIFIGIQLNLSKLYMNSLLAMLNSRSRHDSTDRATRSEVISLPIVLHIAPHSSGGDGRETDISSIPLPDIASVNNKLAPSEVDLGSQV